MDLSETVRNEVGETLLIVVGSILIVMPFVARRFSDPDTISIVGAIIVGLFYTIISLLLHHLVE